jgi:hypothetical protein
MHNPLLMYFTPQVLKIAQGKIQNAQNNNRFPLFAFG